MKRINSLGFYTTRAHPCSYLPDRNATTLFADPAFPMVTEIYSQLCEQGFRRSGEHIYRPHCQQCNACIPLRIPVADFQADRQQKRCWIQNQDLSIEIVEDIRSGEHYRLYERYINERHQDGDMYPASLKQYESFLDIPAFSRDNPVTHYIEFRQGSRLMAVAVTDILAAGLSAIYTFYEPDEPTRSLGVFSVLFQIELALRLGLPHLYLGYWIQDSRKMAYKKRYRPHEVFLQGRWTAAE
jgi:arginyl-tRNA--protein-N-Asp/Glu arginylyltransferase